MTPPPKVETGGDRRRNIGILRHGQAFEIAARQAQEFVGGEGLEMGNELAHLLRAVRRDVLDRFLEFVTISHRSHPPRGMAKRAKALPESYRSRLQRRGQSVWLHRA